LIIHDFSGDLWNFCELIGFNQKGGLGTVKFPYCTEHYWQTAIIGTGCDSIVLFLVLGSASSGTVICWALYQNWTLCTLSHFRYWALSVPVQSFVGPHTRTGLYAHCPVSGTGLCQFWYGRLLGPIPEMDSMCIVPFPVLGSASFGEGGLLGPVPELEKYVHCPISGTGLCQFRYCRLFGSHTRTGLCVVGTAVGMFVDAHFIFEGTMT
jgi:hypothetical protein